jgi:hypothetical protein
MRTQITSGHTRRAAAASRDLTPSRTASWAAISRRNISPRRDAMHLPARALGPLPHVLKPPHAAHGQPRQRRRELLIGRQLRHALTAETPKHLGDLRRTHHRKLHTAQFRRLPTRSLPTRHLPTDLGTPGPRWLVASASSGPPSNAGRSFTPTSRATGPPNSTPGWANSAATQRRCSSQRFTTTAAWSFGLSEPRRCRTVRSSWTSSTQTAGASWRQH